MKKLLVSLMFASAAFTFSALSNANANVTEVSVSAVQEFVKAKAPNVAIVDANNEQARAEVGMVPGAIKLSSYSNYALSELPADKSKTLVFYCYNSYCGASHAAAERAISAGYTDARVMKAGIVGWNEATKK
jgi:rhodanese-related sulfurtransferase